MELVSQDHPALKTVCRDVNPDELGEEFVDFCEGLIALMKRHGGMGIAAPQVGDLRRVVIVSYAKQPLVMINPVISRVSPRRAMLTEGCLSFPGKFRMNPKRSKEVLVDFLDMNGTPTTRKFLNLEAVCVQHEIDHLNGITI